MHTSNTFTLVNGMAQLFMPKIQFSQHNTSSMLEDQAAQEKQLVMTYIKTAHY